MYYFGNNKIIVNEHIGADKEREISERCLTTCKGIEVKVLPYGKGSELYL